MQRHNPSLKSNHYSPESMSMIGPDKFLRFT
jgi:hypothetical protein